MADSCNTRTLLATAALLAGAALLTACNGDDVTGSSSPTPAGTSAAAEAKTAGAKGVSGTFAGGLVEYLAPGKHIVSADGKEQQFFLADDTEVYGAGAICGEYNPAADTACTIDDLEKVLKSGSVAADVVMKNGVATTVTERPAPDEGAAVDDSEPGTGAEEGQGTIEGIDKGKGVNGTWFGNVTYLAPGKYTVSEPGGKEQQFFVAEDTEIWGYGDICGDENTGEGGQGGTECTEAELEAAAKGGFSAEVVVANGIATTVRDDH
ncbi:hypothetical protein [Streptomyces sp. NBC_01092]|uniref:hypothetical protein n=1 Tax=Streptomyces sp. NBC_01092 TaxID=2903748 RepID=UPI00386C6E58|nr:hypothetical protein OG254_45950 [Streptomyces sp. NBC_01092]